jgi:hypothetical protein
LDGWRCGMRIYRSLRERTEGPFWGRVSFVTHSKAAAHILQDSLTATNLWTYVFMHIACTVLIRSKLRSFQPVWHPSTRSWP